MNKEKEKYLNTIVYGKQGIGGIVGIATLNASIENCNNNGKIQVKTANSTAFIRGNCWTNNLN